MGAGVSFSSTFIEMAPGNLIALFSGVALTAISIFKKTQELLHARQMHKEKIKTEKIRQQKIKDKK